MKNESKLRLRYKENTILKVLQMSQNIIAM